ncbi:uncharacterized protein [Dendrobates tinctorius]|uniref:uncharacterized protein isoform X2 n=1 Tax=Dendrobates tinctorius TaxID=92724 RepID=UPI003CCA1284
MSLWAHTMGSGGSRGGGVVWMLPCLWGSQSSLSAHRLLLLSLLYSSDMGDNDSRTEGSGLRTDDSSGSLESLHNREEHWENNWRDPRKPGRRRLKSISMSDIDVEYHPSDNMQESRDRKFISVSDLEEKSHVGANMQNYVPCPPVYRSTGSTDPSLAESGVGAEGSCWPTPSESLQNFNYSEERISNCENPSMPAVSSSFSTLFLKNFLPRRHLDGNNKGGIESILMELGFATEGSSTVTHSDTICNTEEQNDSSESPSKMPQMEQLCLEEPAESEDKEKKESTLREEQLLLDRSGVTKVKEVKRQQTSISLYGWSHTQQLKKRSHFNGPKSHKVLLSRGRPPCQESWIWVGDRCYYFSNTTNTWNASRDFCTKHRSTLAVLMDQKIKKTIERYRENVNYWIGLSMDHKGQWMWTDGSLYNGRFFRTASHLCCMESPPSATTNYSAAAGQHSVVVRKPGACWLFIEGNCRFQALCRFRHDRSACWRGNPASRCTGQANKAPRQNSSERNRLDLYPNKAAARQLHSGFTEGFFLSLSSLVERQHWPIT